MKHEILIVGGGLSGLSLAYFLQQHGINSSIIEASSRLGGRVETRLGKLGTPMELGATWFSEEHVHLNSLLDELKLRKFIQYKEGISFFHTHPNQPVQQFEVSPKEPATYRISGGTERLIDALLEKLVHNTIYLNELVTSIEEVENQLLVSTSSGKKMHAEKVIVCLPPQLIQSSIRFSPSLPVELTATMAKVQTWMGGSIKFVIEYEKAFWRNQHLSGMLFSHVGVVTEMYDHTNEAENKFGFTGFLHPQASTFSMEERKKHVIEYLASFFGEAVKNFKWYKDKIWKGELLLGGNPPIQNPHQNNGHQLLLEPYMKRKLFFSGTETSSVFPGYMDAAVASAKRTALQIIKN